LRAAVGAFPTIVARGSRRYKHERRHSMAKSSIAGGSIPPEQWMRGKDTQSLGPGDSSDTGSDTLGAYSDEALASDSDAAGTGERAGAIGDERPDADILPDRTMDEAGFLEEGAGDEEESGEGDGSWAAGGAEEVAGIVADEEDEDEEDDEYGESEDGDATARGSGL
jgi:hypothetical protein